MGYTYSPTKGTCDFLGYKLDENGNIQKHKSFGGSKNDWCFSAQQTFDNGYICSGITDSYTNGGYDVLVYKLSASGKLEWRRNYGGEDDDYLFSIKQTLDGGFVFAGTTHSYEQNPGKTDVLIYKLDPFGNVEWKKNY